ncbi:MAG: hypothetical protein EXS13_14800 [Planctomycetes bacterium]|nr:hypothetical protein [Planctomycetota bacterium]
MRRSDCRSKLIPRLSIAASLLAASCAAEGGDPGLDPSRATLSGEAAVQLAAALDAELAARAHDDPLDRVPAVRAARLALAQARAEAARAGAVPLMADVEHVGRGATHETELMVALDLAALAGGGRQAALRAQAQAELLRAEAALAAARFAAGFGLQRVQTRFHAIEQLAEEFGTLAAAAAPTLHRMELLEERGWLAEREVEAARAMRHHLEAGQAELAAKRAEALAAIAIAYGRSDGAALSELAAYVEAIQPSEATVDEADAARLLRDHPELQVARAKWLVAEAAVRAAAAEQWPALLIGPKAMLASDDWMLGGLARLELPWPPAAAAAVDATRRARDAARETLATELAASRVLVEAARARCDIAWQARDDHVVPIARSRAKQLAAAAARFAVDSGELADWTMAFEQRIEALAAEVDAREAATLAAIDLAEALGIAEGKAP